MSYPATAFNYSFGPSLPGLAPVPFSHSNGYQQHQQTIPNLQIPSLQSREYYGKNVIGEQYHEEVQHQPTRKRRPKTRQKNSAEPLRVTPIQGPIFVKDGHVPVVPLFSYPAVNNGTFYQIPILWTALSYALGLEVRGEILRGLPCIKRLNQLFCPTAGNTYPSENIEMFIDQNKALIKRMYGEFIMGDPVSGPAIGGGGNVLRRSAREIYEHEIPEHLRNLHLVSGPQSNRTTRQTVNPKNGPPVQQPKSNRVDSCESTTDIVTPYWAASSSGKVRAIVNTMHFEQAIHQEVCAKTSTRRCDGECGCEQKYKWHRLLAYDPENDCKGIFMDWFLFPSCCVCRCDPS